MGAVGWPKGLTGRNWRRQGETADGLGVGAGFDSGRSGSGLPGWNETSKTPAALYEVSRAYNGEFLNDRSTLSWGP